MENFSNLNKPKVNFTRVCVVLTDELGKRLDIEAAKRTTNRSLLIREACEIFLKENSSAGQIG